MDRQHTLQLFTYRALLALCRRLRVPEGDLPPDVTDYSGDWLGDVVGLAQIEAERAKQ